METAAARIAVKPFEFVPFEHAPTSGHVHGEIDDTKSALDAMVLHRDELGWPLGAMIDSV